LALVSELLAIRRREIVPRLAGAVFGETQATDEGLVTAAWRMGDGATLRLRANLSTGMIADETRPSGNRLWGSLNSGTMPPWSLGWWLEAR
jgi:maltooligosyltrehalose trehalohydrolase